MEKKLKIGILGGGDIAWKAYLPMLVKWPEVEILGIYSRSQETVDRIGNHFGVAFRTTDLGALMARGIQAAFVLTHTDSHFEIASALLAAGVDAFVEKPATRSSEETGRLAALADREQRILMVAYNRRFAPLYQQAKEIFGGRTIRQCVVEKHRPGIMRRDLFQTFLDDTIHQIDLLRFYCGEVEPMHTAYCTDEGIFRSAVCLCKIPSGGLGVVQTSRQAGMWQERVTLHGDDLTVEVSAFREIHVKHKDYEERYGRERAGIWMPQLEERGFHGEVQHFFDCVHSRSQPRTNAHDSVKTQALMEAMVDRAIAYG